MSLAESEPHRGDRLRRRCVILIRKRERRDAVEVRQGGGRAVDRAGHHRRRIDGAQRCQRGTELRDVRGVHLGDHEPVGKLRLGAAQRLQSQLHQPVQRVDGDDHLAHQDVMGEDRIVADRADDGRGIRQPARLQHDPVDAQAGDTAVGELAQEGDEAAAPGATGAAARQGGKTGRAAHHHLVDRRVRGLVDDDMGAVERALMQPVAEPRRLARAEEAAENGQLDPAVGRAGHRRPPMRVPASRR